MRKKAGFQKGIAAMLAAVMTMTASGTVFAQAKQIADQKPPAEPVSAVATPPAIEPETEPTIVGELEDRREANVKQFLMSDGSISAAVYGDPVHYEENGEWAEIDNSLSQQAALDSEDVDGVSNQKNDFKVKFANKGDSKKLVSLKKGTYKLSWQIVGASGVKLNKQQKAADKQEEPDPTAVKNQSDGVTYENLLPNVDVRYTVASKTVKEDIILKNKEAGREYQILFDLKKLAMKQNEDGSIDVTDPKEGNAVVFHLNAPYVYDAAGESTTKVDVTLTPQKKGTLLTLAIDEKWLSAPERKFPVTLDPAVETDPGAGTAVNDAIIQSDQPNTAYPNEEAVRVGSYNPNKGVYAGNFKTRTLIKFSMPNLPAGAKVINAKMVLCSLEANHLVEHGDKLVYYYPITNGTDSWYPIQKSIGAYAINQYWTPTTGTWNHMSTAFDSTPSDFVQYAYDTKNPNKAWIWDVTEIVSQWHNGRANYGIMLKEVDETVDVVKKGTSDAWFISSQWAETVRPTVLIQYLDTKGLEDTGSYTQQSMGAAGAGYVNNFTGNLTYVHADTTGVGGRMPVSISHVYNQNGNSDIGFGDGFRLNISQRVKWMNPNSGDALQREMYELGYHWKYTDGDGTDIYFYKSEGKWIDEMGKGLILFSDTNTNLQTITDKDGNKLVFYDGPLGEIHDTNGNVIKIEYSGDKPVKVTDPAGKVTSLTYSGGRLSKITEPTGKAATFTYDQDRLVSITRTDKGITQLGYKSGLTAVRDSVTGYAVTYDYDGIITVSEYASSTWSGNTVGVSESNLGQRMTIDRETARQTVCRAPGKDAVYGNADDLLNIYQFDRYGKVTTVSTTSADRKTHYGTSSSGYTPNVSKTPDSTPSLSQAYQVNKVTESSFVGKNTVNMVENHSFENNTGTEAYKWWISDWSHTGSKYTARYDAAGYQGKYAAKLTMSTKSDEFVGFATDVFRPDANKQFTLSAYVKTENVVGEGANLNVYMQKTDGSAQVVTSEKITGSSLGWQRLSVTFTTPSNIEWVHVYAGLTKSTGTVYADCFQVEEGTTPSPYNLMQNGGFEINNSYWSGSQLEGSDMITLDEKLEGHKAFQIKGNQDKKKFIMQTIPINTANNDERSFIVSGWAKANATFQQSGRALSIAIELKNATESTWIPAAEFDWDQEEWQFSSRAFNVPAGKNYDTLNIYLCYYQDVGSVVFDNIQVLQASHNNYQYDGKGNVKEASPSAQQQSNMVFNDDNLLTSQTDAMGNKTQYEYQQNTRNLQNTISPEGVVNDYVYDSFGNLIRSQAGHQLIAYYSFDDTYKDTNSSTGTATGHGTSFAAGKYGKALSFNGSSYLEFPMIKTPDSFTLSMWVKPSKTDSGQGFLGKSEKNGNDLLLLGYYSNSLHAKVGSTTLNAGTRSTNWQHLVLTVSKLNSTTTEIQLYQDSKLVGTRRCTGLVGNGYNGKNIILGADWDNVNGTATLTDYFTGLIDDVAFFEGILTPQEIAKVAKGVNKNDFTYVMSAKSTYTDDGRFLTSSSDDFRLKTSYTYDENKGLLTSMTSPKKVTANYAYNSYDLPESISATADGKTYSNRYTYNSKRQLSGITHNGFTYSMEYTPFGQLAKTKVGNRTLMTNTYGANNGLLNRSTYGNGDYVDYTYDNLGRVTSRKLNGTVKHQWEYDSFGRNILYKDLVSGRTHRYDYDPIGRVLGFRSSGNGYSMLAQYQYNKNNQISSTTYQINGKNLRSSYSYNKDGQVTNSFMNGANTYPTYDKIGRLSSTRYQDSSSSTSWETKINYRTYWDLATNHTGSRVDSMTYLKNGKTVASTGYHYNSNYEIYSYSESYEKGVKGQYQSYEFDKLGQLTRENNQIGNTTTLYEYDNAGNILRKKEYGYTTVETSSLGTPTKTVEYTYGDSGWKDLLTKWDGWTIKYDDMGNPTTYKKNMICAWDGRQLTYIGGGPINSTDFTYNADGVRTSKTTRGIKTQFYLDGNRIVREESSDGSFDFYYDGNGQMQKLVFYRQSTGSTGGETYFPRYNLMGDVTALVDTQGNVVVKYAYDAWGKVLSVTDGSGNAITDEYHVGNQNPFRYRGYYYDTETGFYYLQSRYYDPEVGRFLNADGVLGANGDLTSYNMFAYCSNMPTVAVDPTGYGLFFDNNGKMVYGDGTTGNSGYYLDGSGNSFFGAEATVEKEYGDEWENIHPMSPITWKTGWKETEIISKKGDSTKPISVYAKGVDKNGGWQNSSAGLKINIGKLSLKINLSLEDIGISGSWKDNDVTSTIGVSASLTRMDVGLTHSVSTNYGDDTTFTQYNRYGINAVPVLGLVGLISGVYNCAPETLKEYAR